MHNKHNKNQNTYNEAPKLNTKAAVAELSSRFIDVTRRVRDGRNNSKGTMLYDWQVEFTYYIDQILRGPIYIAPKYVSIVHHLINTIDTAVKSPDFSNKKPS